MIIVKSPKDLKVIVRELEKIVLVPTMGNLHKGHIELIKEAQKFSKNIVVSIFVNPIQFDSQKDLKNYPRSFVNDKKILKSLKVNYLFAPNAQDIYPSHPKLNYKLPEISNELCGASRPGHFLGVITVIEKLLNLSKPHYLVLGKKDYQQLYLIKKFISDLSYPITIIEVETVRAKNQLALSSRNNLIKPELKDKSSDLYRSIYKLTKSVKNINNKLEQEQQIIQLLVQRGWQVDYLEIRRQLDLKMPVPGDTHLVVLVAAKLGKVRLVDNIEFCIEPSN
tara:strand:+ start:251 stop:1090 length:840 start_codon:yes stop_codon:yes gene_type:complete